MSQPILAIDDHLLSLIKDIKDLKEQQNNADFDLSESKWQNLQDAIDEKYNEIGLLIVYDFEKLHGEDN